MLSPARVLQHRSTALTRLPRVMKHHRGDQERYRSGGHSNSQCQKETYFILREYKLLTHVKNMYICSGRWQVLSPTRIVFLHVVLTCIQNCIWSCIDMNYKMSNKLWNSPERNWKQLTMKLSFVTCLFVVQTVWLATWLACCYRVFGDCVFDRLM